jgi:type II secretory pathway pseudopilin PulG
MKNRLEMYRAENGHTIVESLVALVLISAVFLTTTQLALKVTNSRYNQELSVAMGIASSTIENIFLTGNYKLTQQSVFVGKQEWTKECRINFENSLVHVSVFVKPISSKNWTYTLYTCRIVNNFQQRRVSPLWN